MTTAISYKKALSHWHSKESGFEALMRNNFFVTRSMMHWTPFTILYMIALKESKVYGCRTYQLLVFNCYSKPPKAHWW